MWLAFFPRAIPIYGVLPYIMIPMSQQKTSKGYVSFKCYKYVGGVMVMID